MFWYCCIEVVFFIDFQCSPFGSLFKTRSAVACELYFPPKWGLLFCNKRKQNTACTLFCKIWFVTSELLTVKQNTTVLFCKLLFKPTRARFHFLQTSHDKQGHSTDPAKVSLRATGTTIQPRCAVCPLWHRRGFLQNDRNNPDYVIKVILKFLELTKLYKSVILNQCSLFQLDASTKCRNY